MVSCAHYAEHQYTESNLRFEHLKGTDRAMARALSTCPGFDAHLVLITRTVHGSTYPPCNYHKRWRGYYSDDEDDGDHTMDEVG